MAVAVQRPDRTSPTSLGSSEEDLQQSLPSALAKEELQLALNKTATLNELSAAIERCKELVLECDQCSPERKWLVRHLIELRLRLQEYREALDDPNHPRNKSGVSKRVIKGHHLQLQPFLKNANFRHCDHCTGTIWSVVQTWYQCDDCGYSCHYKCLEGILRVCAHITASEKGCYEHKICPEIGLAAQKYACAECNTPIPITAPKGYFCFGNVAISDGIWCEARKCDYTGLYYCTACHWGSSSVIPARIIHNWDFTLYPVSQASLQLLRITLMRPLINLERLNPRLFNLIHELSFVKRLRNELANMRRYLLACRSADENHLLWKTLEHPYLIEFPDLYSLQDLVETENGELPARLQDLLEKFSKHIKEDCEICRGHGHICEICSNENVLFPFEEMAYVCDKCGAAFHKKCIERKEYKCLKCARISARKEMMIGEVVD